ncbi:MAG: hypothetical protein PHQ12_01140 [Chthoniobacteraceae bacterium]|nr:hypothetical protein [Chthoniobacteraceae bacterium]
MTSQYEVLQPFVTERIRELVRGRLLEGLKFFDGHNIRPGFDRAEVKLALLLTKIGNPMECLSIDETSLLDSPMRQQQVKSKSEHIKVDYGQIKASLESPKKRD